MPDVLSSRRYEPKFIDLDNKNTSHGRIISLVGNDKTVLEIGTSTGYVSKILKENGNAVTGVEIDPEAGALAKQYCESMLIGDIEDLDLGLYLKESYFDVIIFGDLLEHIKEPGLILEKVKKYLKSDGYLLASLPNICHGDVILNLLIGDFKYMPVGILDSTHLRFFALKNIIQLFNGSGYRIIDVYKVTVPVGNTELKMESGKFPAELLDLIRSIPDSDVYQYVLKLGTGDMHGAEQLPEITLNDISMEDVVKKWVGEYNQEISRLRASNQEAFTRVKNLEDRLADNDDRISILDRELKKASKRVGQLEQEIADMRRSVLWRLAMAYHNGLIERLFPPWTRRRNAYDGFLRSARGFVNEGPFGIWKKYAQYKKERAAKPKFPRTVENLILPDWRASRIKDFPVISIIIVTYNSEPIVGTAIESIIRQDYPLASLELVIIDNGSVDNTAEAVNRYVEKYKNKLSIKLIETGKNYGFGVGVNIGVRNLSTEAEYVMLVNPDCQIYNDTINELVSAALATMPLGYRLWECRQMPYEHPKHYSPVTLETSWSSGACFMVHKNTFEDLGGFDPNIFLYMEDVDLSWRLRMNGYKLMYDPFARVRHDTYSEANIVKSVQYYNSALYMFYLRYKYGSLEDILSYYREFLRLIKDRPNRLPHMRLMLMKQFARHCLLIPKALTFRLHNRKKLKTFKPWFMGYDFEFSRKGAFVRSDLDPALQSHLPQVSIVVRTIGRKGFLREALTSIRNQTYGNIETVVVEDGPATVKEMLDREFGHMNIKYFSLGERRGRCKAGNFGLSQCGGRYLRFLDEDDLLYATSVEAAVFFMLEDGGKHKLAYDLSFEVPTQVLSEEPLRYIEQDYKLVYDRELDRKKLMHHNFIPIQDVLFDRELYERYGGFDESLDALEDWDLWIRYSQHTDFLRIPKITSLYRVPAVMVDIEKRQAKLDEYYQAVRRKHNYDIIKD